MDALNQPFGPLTLLQWFLSLGGLMVFFAVVNSMAASRKARKGEEGAMEAKCLGCGWRGKVSRFHRTCPKCGNSITRLSKNEV